jgi:hypothetical protein
VTGYTDVERSAVMWLQALMPGDRICTDLPATVAGRVVRLGRLGGGEIGPRLEHVDLDADCFAPTRTGAQALAETVRHHIRDGLPGTELDGSVYTHVQTYTGPMWRPWDNPALWRFGLTFRLAVHHVSSG